MIEARFSEDRGRAYFGWLDSRHTFSFGEYFDRDQMGFRALRVINDDRVDPAGGFPPHGHRDMEILSVVLEGELEHRDSLGSGSVIRPGEVQRMSAGRGILHSEFNPSRTDSLRFLQIWILPDAKGHDASYEQKTFDTKGRFRLVASPDGADDSLLIHQDVRLFIGDLSPGECASAELPRGRFGYVHVATGSGTFNGRSVAEGDGFKISDETDLSFTTTDSMKVLFFDLA